MKSKIKKTRILLITLFLLVICLLLIKMFYKGFNSNLNSQLNSTYSYNQRFDKTDSILFKKDEFKNIKSRFILKSNYRNDIKCFEYKKNNLIYYTKIDLLKDIQMDQFIWFREKSTSTTVMHSYDKFSLAGVYDFYTFGEKTHTVNKIIFSLIGDGKLLQRNVYNKNFVSYYLPVNSFSLRYGENEPIDIFFGGKETLLGRETYPLMISFYKTHKSLFVLLLIPDKDEMNLDGALFGKIMNDNSNLNFKK